MEWKPGQYMSVKPGWLSGLKKRSGVNDLFCYYDKEHEVYFLACWTRPSDAWKKFSMVESFGKTHPNKCKPPAPEEVVSRTRWFDDIAKGFIAGQRQKKVNDYKEKMATKEYQQHMAKFFKKKGLAETAALIEQGVLPLGRPEE